MRRGPRDGTRRPTADRIATPGVLEARRTDFGQEEQLLDVLRPRAGAHRAASEADRMPRRRYRWSGKRRQAVIRRAARWRVLPDVSRENARPPHEHGPALVALARLGLVGPRAVRARDGPDLTPSTGAGTGVLRPATVRFKSTAQPSRSRHSRSRGMCPGQHNGWTLSSSAVGSFERRRHSTRTSRQA